MHKPTLSEFRRIAGLIAIFFLLSGVAQYWFVRYQDQIERESGTEDDAADLNRGVAFSGQVDLAHFRKADI